ncbi:MAG: hypothetical protein M3Y85_08820 [Bacteroidota bacterium]|nr:hypothetical protein [Bacteroidota bacterium]
MKRVLLLLLLGFSLSPAAYSQTVPKGMKYQAVARNLSGDVLANQKSTLKISLVTVGSGGKASAVYYSETHDVTTDLLGLFTLVIGEGKVQTGSFNKVPWSTEDIWMEVAIKDKNETNFSTISNSKLLAVPYAFHAATANALTGSQKVDAPVAGGNTPGVPSQNWSLFGNSKSGPSDKLGTTDFADLIMVTNDLERLRITAAGNINIARSLKVGANLTVDSSAFLNKVSGSTFNYGPFTVDRLSPTYLTGKLTVDKETNLNSLLNVNNASPSFLSGTLTVVKATELNNTLKVDGSTNLNSSLTVNNSALTTLSGPLKVDGSTNLNSSVNVNNQSPTVLSGTLKVDKTTSLNGQVTVSATLPPDQENINNYPLIVQGSRNGVAIKVQGEIPNRNENFITFWAGDGSAKGRVEGFAGSFNTDRSAFISLVNNANGQDSNSTQSQDPNQPLPPAPTALQNINNNYAFGALNATLSLVQNIVKFVINLIACIAGVGIFGDCDDVAWSGIDMAISAIQFAGYIAYNEGNPGVAYESGGADYAEWLPKFNKDEPLAFGDVVGVKAGVISKTFANAEKFMVVSRSPGVIGGMPDADKEMVYEKIAFMGQVPIKVVGKVHKEDYILPSGNGDGMAIAIRPDKMQAKDFKRIIGVAWSASDSLKDFNYINTAVGIHANDMAGTVEDMQYIINDMQLAIAKVDKKFKPSLYALNKRDRNYSTEYTKAPSLRETIGNNVGMGNYSNAREALKGINSYAVAQGADLKQFAYLSTLLENPTQESAQKALDHYTKVLNNLETIMVTAQKQRYSIQKN